MPANKLVAVVLLVCLALVGGYDLWAALRHGGPWTVSAVVRAWSAEYPIIPFLAGLVVGHLWWRGQ